MNGYRLKTDRELSPYQRRVEQIENVILCVAEVEKMVSEIGKNLFPGLERVVKKTIIRRRVASLPWRSKTGFQR